MKSIGNVKHFDLTVPDAGAISAFYEKVVGWSIQALSMGDCGDYVRYRLIQDPAGAYLMLYEEKE